MIEWAKIPRDDVLIIGKIASRFHDYRMDGIIKRTKKSTIMMDVSAAHIKCPLDLKGLLDSEDVDFIHDVVGINRHVDRDTGELKDCFLPRFAIANKVKNG